MAAALVKGQNAGLAAGQVVLSVRGGVAADLSALLVTAAGKVRSDADFVFFNQPQAPGVRLHGAELEVSLGAVPGEIAQIRAVITVAAEGDTFGAAASPVATVADSAGTVLHEYVIDGLGRESVVIALELYRRQGSWKVRAVGQGYAGGFAALVTDHGVQVDDSPAQAAPQQAAPPPPPPQQAPPAYPAQSAPGYPQQPAPAYAPPGGGYPPPPGPAQQPPGGYPPPPGQGYPPPAQGAPQQPPGEISLSKDRPVSLQ